MIYILVANNNINSNNNNNNLICIKSTDGDDGNRL